MSQNKFIFWRIGLDQPFGAYVLVNCHCIIIRRVIRKNKWQKIDVYVGTCDVDNIFFK